MRKLIAFILLAGMLATAAGCAAARPEEDISSSKLPEAVGNEIEAAESGSPDTHISQRLGSAVKDAYTGIEIDAFIRERKAILPGFSVPVTVIVTNSGDKAVDYVFGSGSYTTPEALFIGANGLQRVLPADYLGPVTMDFRTEELRPGERLEFVMYVMAVEPNVNFDRYTIEMYNDGGEYIADKNWDELHKEFPDLVPAEPGSYQGRAYFLYYTRNESGVSDFTSGPSGYAAYDFTIAVS